MSEARVSENTENPVSDEYEDEEEEEPMTSRGALDALENAWLNEKFAPEILPHQSDLVELMLTQVEHIENHLESLDKNNIKLMMHTLELSRVKYVISSYLRIRLLKIERYVDHLLEEESNRTEDEKYLTHDELQFATEYSNGVQKIFDELALDHIPTFYNNKRWSMKPNLDAHVFCKVRKNVNRISVAEDKDEEEINLQVGSQHIVKYKAIGNLVKNGSVQLI